MRIRIWDRLKAMWGMLFAWSIWHPDSISLDEWKYRDLKRIWLPLYDLIAIFAGVWAMLWGSPMLNRIFSDSAIDTMGFLLSSVALVCLLGVSFPKLWKMEIVGKVFLLSLLAAYALAVSLFPSNADPANLFVTFVLALALPLPTFRLRLLGEEIKERREDEPK